MNPNQKTMNESIYALLLAEGWKEYQDQFRKYVRCFCKRFETPTRCACNHRKEGMQVTIAATQHGTYFAYEIELHGELPDGTWIKMHNHGMPDDIEAGLATIPRLLATWEFIATHHESINQTPKP
jgi:hypothetical protein